MEMGKKETSKQIQRLDCQQILEKKHFQKVEFQNREKRVTASFKNQNLQTHSFKAANESIS